MAPSIVAKAAVMAVALMVSAGCTGPVAAPNGPSAPVSPSAPSGPFSVTLPEVTADGSLPVWSLAQVTGQCDGENRSPALEWDNAPTGTAAFAVTMVNPEQLRYPHWVVTGISSDATGLAAADQGEVTEGTVGATFAGSGSYVGPCWAGAEYVYTVYALDTLIEGDQRTTYAALLDLIDGHVLAEASATAFAPEGAYEAG
jgi:Raf kinase inhibitor-like YbhB/YbcL family protein